MLPAQTLSDINTHCSSRYEQGERRIVGIMVARGNRPDVKKLIEEYYQYWHLLSGRSFDIFWLGYAPQLLGEAEPSPAFNTNAFVLGTKALEDACGFQYRERFGLLLFNYHSGNIQFDRYRYYDMTDLFYRRPYRLGEFTHKLIRQCSIHHDIRQVAHRLLGLQAKYMAIDIAPDVLKKLWGKAIS